MSNSDHAQATPSIRLPDTQWDQMIQHMSLTPRAEPGEDRRAAGRHDFSTDVTLFAEFDDEDGCWQRYLVKTSNVSAMGLGFVHDIEVPLGNRSVFTVMDKHGQPCTLTGTVSRVDPTESGYWDVGVRFDRPIDPSHLLDVEGKPLAQAG